MVETAFQHWGEVKRLAAVQQIVIVTDVHANSQQRTLLRDLLIADVQLPLECRLCDSRSSEEHHCQQATQKKIHSEMSSVRIHCNVFVYVIIHFQIIFNKVQALRLPLPGSPQAPCSKKKAMRPAHRINLFLQFFGFPFFARLTVPFWRNYFN